MFPPVIGCSCFIPTSGFKPFFEPAHIDLLGSGDSTWYGLLEWQPTEPRWTVGVAGIVRMSVVVEKSRIGGKRTSSRQSDDNKLPLQSNKEQQMPAGA